MDCFGVVLEVSSQPARVWEEERSGAWGQARTKRTRDGRPDTGRLHGAPDVIDIVIDDRGQELEVTRDYPDGPARRSTTATSTAVRPPSSTRVGA